jgi:3-hydroxyisobutyrate dehydrogenase-like beta-hydroxyacid dehydrogenase
MKIAVIGLGRMGAPIAAHIGRVFPDAALMVYDKQHALLDHWVAAHDGEAAKFAKSAEHAVNDSDFVVTSLPADKELLAVVDQVGSVLPAQVVWIDHSTTSALVARQIADRFSGVNASFLDAPVSGGVEGAKQGTLTVMVGGGADAFEKAQPVIQAYSSRIKHMGGSGAGQITKMTNQICVLGLCQALAEGLDFAERAGLDADKVVDVMLQGSSASWQMKNRSQQMLGGDYDFGFSTQLMRKDVGLVLDHARAMGANLPATELVSELLDELDSMGGANWDWCSLMERQRRS